MLSSYWRWTTELARAKDTISHIRWEINLQLRRNTACLGVRIERTLFPGILPGVQCPHPLFCHKRVADFTRLVWYSQCQVLIQLERIIHLKQTYRTHTGVFQDKRNTPGYWRVIVFHVVILKKFICIYMYMCIYIWLWFGIKNEVSLELYSLWWTWRNFFSFVVNSGISPEPGISYWL